MVCVVVTYIPVRTRVLPGYETLQQTDQGTRYLKNTSSPCINIGLQRLQQPM